MCTFFYSSCNWVCDQYSDIYKTTFSGCRDIKVYVEDGRRGAKWRDIPVIVQSIEVG